MPALSGAAKMIVTLNGDNAFDLQRELQKITDSFVKEHGDLALERVDGEEAEFAKINEALTSLPFLASKKLVVLRRPSANKQFVESVEQLLSDIPATNDVILVEPKLDKRLAYFKYLKKSTDFREYTELDVYGISQWLVDSAKVKDGSISSSDARYLAERVGINQQLLEGELEKLLLYDSKITRQTIDLLIDPTPQSTIFQLLEAAFAGNTKQAIKLYQEQRSMKVEPVQIIAMLTWQLNVLAIIKTAGSRSEHDIAREAKIKPYVVGKSQAIASKLSLSELKSLIKDLLDIDVASKRTNLDIDEALQQYILKLAE
jgi:DNA polymerase-3 subunit delta